MPTTRLAILYNYFRDYDPAVGRFAQSDPIGLLGGLNTYVYVGSNPINKIDPEGLKVPGAGGAWSPPSGVSFACNIFDSCPELLRKMWVFRKMILSHQGWDRRMAAPRGGGRHAIEIAQLWNGYAKCQWIFLSKPCGTCGPFPEEPVLDPRYREPPMLPMVLPDSSTTTTTGAGALLMGLAAVIAMILAT